MDDEFKATRDAHPKLAIRCEVLSEWRGKKPEECGGSNAMKSCTNANRAELGQVVGVFV